MTELDSKLKNQLLDLAEMLNAFKSEAVQVKIADKLLSQIFIDNKLQAANPENGQQEQNLTSRRAKRVEPHKGQDDNSHTRERKPTGATKAMYRLLGTDFFDQPKTISAIASRYNQEFNGDFKTSEISGILLKTVRENLLKREKNLGNKRYEYVKI